jgi:hypothetical protein
MALLVPLSPGKSWASEWLSIGHTGFVSGDSTLTLTMPFVGQPSLSIQSSAAGDFKWIEANVPVAIGDTFSFPVIDAVAVCYKAPNAGTFISQIRLSDMLGPSTGFVRHDDPTDLTSPTDTCYISPVANYVPQGSVNLSLRLFFADPSHKIWIGAVAVHGDFD